MRRIFKTIRSFFQPRARTADGFTPWAALREARAAGFAWLNPGTGILEGPDGAPIAGAGVAVSASRNITAADNGMFLKPTGTMTLTIPAGLTPMPSFSVDCPASGTVTIAVSGGATLNGATSSLTRTRAANPVGFVVLAHELDAYGVSGA
jgi:hypothetical protein